MKLKNKNKKPNARINIDEGYALHNDGIAQIDKKIITHDEGIAHKNKEQKHEMRVLLNFGVEICIK